MSLHSDRPPQPTDIHGLDLSHAVPKQHVCKPPGRGFPPRWSDQPTGARFHCECGQAWITRWVDTATYGARATVAHSEWFCESRRERRQRLGLSVWRDWLERVW